MGASSRDNSLVEHAPRYKVPESRQSYSYRKSSRAAGFTGGKYKDGEQMEEHRGTADREGTEIIRR